MATLKFTPSNRVDLSQVPITEGQFILTNDTNEAFYDVAYDIRFKTSSFVALDTDADRFKLSNNDKASAGKVYYVKGTQLFYTWTQEKNWNNVIASQEISKVIGDYKNITPTTLVKGEERFAPLTIASQVYTDDGETVESKVRQISHISSSFDSIVVTKKGKTFNIPVPFEGYFNYPNAMLVYIGTVQIYPNRYSVENNTITFQEEVDINRTINFQFIYNTQAPKLETMNFIDGAYIAKGTIPIDRMVKYSNDYMTNDTTAVATSAAVKGLYDVMANLMDRSAIVIRCTTKDDNSHMGTNLSDDYKLIDGNIILTRFHADVADNATITVGGVAYPIFVGASPVKAGQIKANDELSLQFDSKSNRLYVTNGMPYLIDSTTYSYTSPVDGESSIRFNALNYNPGTDKLEVFQDGIRLIEGRNYKFSETSKSITLIGYTADKGDTFEIVVYKVSRTRGNNSQITIYRPELDESVNQFRNDLIEFKREIQKEGEKTLDIIVPVYDTYKSLDTDSGDCEIIGIDKKYWFMIDCYMDDPYIYQNIKRCLKENQIESLEFILISHYHNDHYGNINRLCDDKLVKKVYIMDVSKTSFQTGEYSMNPTSLKQVDNMIKAACDRNSIPWEIAPNGIMDFHGATLTFYNNSDEDYDALKKTGTQNYNDVSQCLLVEYIGRTAVFEGDVQQYGMFNTVKYIPTAADFLKSHHHGINVMPLFYQKIRPRDVFVTAGRKYMHGNQVTHPYMGQLSEMGSNIFCLGDQIEDMHIEYKAKNNTIRYNKNIIKDGFNYQGDECSVYVNPKYTGDLQTGDLFTPFKYLSDAIRYIHQNHQGLVSVILEPFDYSSDPKHINQREKWQDLIGYLILKNSHSQISFYPWRNGEVILPAMYIRECSRVEFNNITFKKQPNCPKIDCNVNINNSKIWFNNCKFVNDIKVNFDCHIKVNEYSKIICDTITFNGRVDYGIMTNDAECSVTVKGRNIANNVGKLFFTAHGSVINIIHPFTTKNDIFIDDDNATANVVFSKKSKGVPTIPGASQGQIVQEFNPYNGPQYYISDGNNGWSVVDQFNIHGDTNFAPKFAGQFAYNKTTSSVSFAVGNNTKDDWVHFANEEYIMDAIELMTGVKVWRSGRTYNKGDVFKNLNGMTFVVVSPTFEFNNVNDNAVTNFTNNFGNLFYNNNQWIQRIDPNDTHLVGELILHPCNIDGYVVANGAEVTIARYPRLYDFAEKNRLWTTDVNKKGLFRKSGTDKFFLPDYRYVYLKADVDASDIGNFVTSSAPNITGEMAIRTQGQIGIEEASGAFVKDSDPTNTGANMETFNKQYFGKKLKFDASRSSAVYNSNSRSIHPDHINLYPMIKF